MDKKQVIKGLESLKQDYLLCKCDTNSNVIDEAIAMLKEQEYLAVYEDKVNKCVCGNEINRYWHPEYCGFCGKKLVWY